MIELREYQREAVEAVERAHGRGVLRPAVVSATGSGKSVMIAELARRAAARGRRTVVLAHRRELIAQNAAEVGNVAPDLSVGVVMGDRNQTRAQVVSASTQTLQTDRRRRMIADVGLVIYDECFPAGTMVAGRPIETIRPGDSVPSWSESDGNIQFRPVLSVMAKRPSSIVRVDLDSGRKIYCTPNHPILTQSGWCPAGLLAPGVYVISFTHGSPRDNELRGVREPGNTDRLEDVHGPTEWPGVLLDDLPGHLGAPRRLDEAECVQPGARLGPHESQQPDAPRGAPGEDGGNDQAYWPQAAHPGRERQAHCGAAAASGGDAGLADRGHGGDLGRGLPAVVQRGHSTPVDEGGRRGGWGIPLLAGPPRIRPTEGQSAHGSRVADVQVLEPGSDGTYGGVCPDGLVYNIEVAVTHTYLIDGGVVVHNCHRAPSPTGLSILRHYGCYDADGGARAAGFTATMSRGDGVALGDVWQEVVFRKSIDDLVREGFLVRPVGKRVLVSDLDLSRVKRTAGDYQADALGAAVEGSLAPKRIAEALLEHAPGRRTILFAPTVHSAGVIAEALGAAGLRSTVVHAETPKRDRARVHADLEARRLDVVCNVGVYVEGTNMPCVDCVVIARPVLSPGPFVQMAGRGLRKYPGKRDCLILMVGDAGRGHSLLAPVELFGEESAQELLREPCLCVVGVPGFLCACGRARCQEECACGGGAADRCGCTRPEKRPGEVEPAGELEVPDGPGRLVVVEEDLFAGSTQTWDRTTAGVWFMTGEARYLVVLPGEDAGTWDVASIPEYPAMPGARWIVRGVSDPGYAMAHAEGDVTRKERNAAARDARWRDLRPTVAQLRAAGLGADASAGEVLGVLRRRQASARIDPALPAYARERL